MRRSLPAGWGGVQARGPRSAQGPGASFPPTRQPSPRLLWFALVFGLGMMEIGLIIVIAVMLFPPKELPKLVRSIAKVYGQVRRTAEDFRNTVLEDEDLREPIDEIKGAYNDARWEVRDAERKARQQLAKAQMDMRMATARRLQAERAEGKTETEDKTEALAAPPAVARAGSAGPVRIAAANNDAAEDEDDANGEATDRQVAGSDPRVISARRPAPPTLKAEPGFGSAGTARGAESTDGDETREGVG
jgi:Sec-independent protein translocase protein TatA